MSKMKDSGIEWIGMIPEEWEITRVKYLAQDTDSIFIDGDWIESDIIVESGVRYLTTGNVGAGYFKEQGSGYITEETFKKLNCLKVLPGDLMISRLNEPIGRACIVPDTEEKYVVAVDNVILRPDDNYNKKYLMYCMNTDGYANAGKEAARGATMQRVSRTLLGGFYVPVASKEEQQLIAEFLDDKVGKIDEILVDLNNQVEILSKYKKSVITQAVTKGLNPDVAMKDSGIEQIGLLPKEWDIKPIKYLCTMQPVVNKKGLRNEDLVSFLPMDHVKNGYFINDESLLENNNSSYTEFNNGDIIMAKVTPCFENGNIAIVDNLYNGFGFGSSELFVFRANNEVCNKNYLFYWLQNDHFIKTATVNMTGAAGLKRVPAYFISHYCVAVPSLKEQQEISDYLDDKCAKIDELIKDKQTQIEKMEKYKKSLIYEYVTGKKRVKGV